jgi:hypothetical protein
MPQLINLYYWPTPNGKKVALFGQCTKRCISVYRRGLASY